MTEFKRGGYIPKDSKPYIPNAGCNGIGYVIPKEFAEKWFEALDKLNEGEYSGVEVVDKTSPGEEVV